MKKMIRRALLGLLLLSMVLSFTGCYTVLRRPGRVTEEEERYLEQGYEEQWGGPSYLWYDPFYYWYYPEACGRWRYYYTYPWWWNDYWFWHGQPGEGPPVDTDRYIWDRRRGPDWSSPPSSPSSPSSPSQPRQRPQKPGEKRQPADSQKDQHRRKPDWRSQPDRSQTPEQKTKGKEEQEERKEEK